MSHLLVGSTRFAVLNYAVSEPEVWTRRAISEDLGVRYAHINEAIINLKQRGFVVDGKLLGRSHTLLPTPLGVEAFVRVQQAVADCGGT